MAMNSFKYQEALRIAAQSMVRFNSPSHLIKMIARYLGKEMGITHASIIVQDHEKKHFVFCDSHGVNKIPVNLVRLDIDNPLIRWFYKKRDRLLSISKDYLSMRQIDDILSASQSLHSDETVKNRLSKIKEHMKTFKAVLCVPGYYKGELLGIFILGEKKNKSDFNDEEISFFQTLASDTSMAIKNYEYQGSLVEKIDALENSLLEIKRLRERDRDKYLQTIITLAQTVDARDPYTYGHSEEIKRLGLLTAQELNLDLEGENWHILVSAFILHDVGKLGVPDEILHKESSLSEEEWFKMRDHVKIGARILENHDDLKEVSVIIMHHHENYDGTGYPYKLKGEEIPIQSRIVSVVDAFHAMVSDRPYRKGLSYDAAIAELKKCSGTQFDTQVVNAFLRVISREIKL